MTTTIEAHVEIAAPPEEVRRTLNDAGERRLWLGPGVPALDPNGGEEPLEFGWQVRGRDTRVRIELAPTAAGTGVTVRHDGLAERRTGEASLRDFWHLALANLRGRVESGEVAGTTDLSPSRGDVRVEVEAAAPAGAVFRALVEPAELDRWIADRAEVERRVGGRYDLGWDEPGGPIRIVDLEPDRRLAYSWRYEDDSGRTLEDETVVEWTLEGSGGRTRIVLVHSGFAPDAHTDDYAAGWLAFLASLKFLVEGGPGWRPPRAARVAEVG